MRNYLTIGELADLLNVNASLIRYYENQGLLEPFKIDENGYRLYDFNQMDKLETLLLMRKMDIPLKQLKMLINNESSEAYKDILQMSLDSIYKQIDELQSKTYQIKKKIHFIDHHLNESNKFSIIQFPTRYLYRIHTGNIFNYSIKYSYDIMKSLNINHQEMFQESYIIKEGPERFSLCLPRRSDNKHLQHFETVILSEGYYLDYSTYSDNYDDFDLAVSDFYKYIDAHNLKPMGNIFAWENPMRSDFYLKAIHHNIQIQIKKP